MTMGRMIQRRKGGRGGGGGIPLIPALPHAPGASTLWLCKRQRTMVVRECWDALPHAPVVSALWFCERQCRGQTNIATLSDRQYKINYAHSTPQLHCLHHTLCLCLCHSLESDESQYQPVLKGEKVKAWGGGACFRNRQIELSSNSAHQDPPPVLVHDEI